VTEPAATVLARFCFDLRWDAVPAPARYRTQELVLDLLGVAVRGSMSESSIKVREYVRTQGAGPATVLGASKAPGVPEGPSRVTFLVGDREGWLPSAGLLKALPDLPRLAEARRAVERPPEDRMPPPPAGPRPISASAAWAALANGTAAHAIEMDDVTTESSLHPGAAVIPAALAVAEELVTGKEWIGHETRWPGLRRPTTPDLLAAVVAGYEVTMRVGNALGAASAYQRGFHPTGVAGVFGAAVAAAKLMHLDAEGLTRAMGIAGTMASGSLAYLDEGSWTKRLNPGWAAHAGVVAAGLAFAGFTGPATVFEGPHGLLRGYTDAPDPDRLTEDLGAGDLQVMHVSLKPYGCCRYSHGLIDAMLAIHAEHISPDSPSPIALEDIARIRLGVLSGGWALIAEDEGRKRDPRNTVDAQFSAPYAAAVALTRGRAGMSEFEIGGRDEAGVLHMGDRAIGSLMGRTECYRDPSLDAAYPKSWPAAVEIHLKDGRVLRKRVEHALGEPENPVGRKALVERFVDMLVPPRFREASGFASISESVAMPEQQARELAERILHLELEPDLSVLQALA
jgi:2-methylcitrate dehydratase PrpD